MKINTVTVIGANGTLGIGVSGIFASFGNAKVYMISRSIEKSNQAIIQTAQSVKANSIMENLVAKDYSDIEKCVKESDLIIETVVEDYDVKKDIHELINKYVKPHAIISSVTSGISINKIAECYNAENKNRFMGIHFFNPPYSMTLCELIPSKYTDLAAIKETKDYLENTLYRKVVIVKDDSGFLANRIGFQFINETMQYAEKYKKQGGIDYIDTIMGLFTGRNMQPIYTANFVGLDVHKAIVDNIYNNTNDYKHETFKLPTYVEDLIKNGKTGMKVDEGLYKYSGSLVYDIETKEYREIKKYNIPFIDKVIEKFKVGDYKNGINIIIDDKSIEAKICKELLVSYIIYSITMADELVENTSDVDIAMAEGFNWIPPYALMELIGKEKCKQIALNDLKIDKEVAKKVFDNNIKSNYRYERFMKAKR